MASVVCLPTALGACQVRGTGSSLPQVLNASEQQAERATSRTQSAWLFNCAVRRRAVQGSLRRQSAAGRRQPAARRLQTVVHVGRSEVEEAIASNPLFNDQFMSVLQDSLARQGEQSLTTAPPSEPRWAPLPEAALFQCSCHQSLLFYLSRDPLSPRRRLTLQCVCHRGGADGGSAAEQAEPGAADGVARPAGPADCHPAEAGGVPRCVAGSQTCGCSTCTNVYQHDRRLTEWSLR